MRMSNYKILVVGAGLMGAGIAQACAQAGTKVYLTDVSKEASGRGYANIKHFVHRKVEKGKIEKEKYEEIISNISVIETYGDAKDIDFAIEVVPENMELKKKVFAALDSAIPKNAIIATNTSTFSITALASATKRPDQVIGTHFFIPAPVMKLVEVIPGILTSGETYDKAVDFVNTIEKTPVKAPDTSAFLVNRLLVPMWNEAAFLVMEGNDPYAIDEAMKLGANLPMGPCELADFAGLDTVLNVMTEMFQSIGEPKYRPCPLLKNMVAAGLYGRKSGRGFYDYA